MPWTDGKYQMICCARAAHTKAAADMDALIDCRIENAILRKELFDCLVKQGLSTDHPLLKDPALDHAFSPVNLSSPSDMDQHPLYLRFFYFVN
jgi:hypothetical protein